MSGGAVKACGCGPLEPCKAHRDAGDLQDWEARARAAEAKLAAIRTLCRDDRDDPCWPHMVAGVLAIIGSEPAEARSFSATCTGPDCGEQFTDSETGEYEFAARGRMVMLLRADGWQADPVLCPACQPEGAGRG